MLCSAVLGRSVVTDFLRPHVLYVACQAPLSMEILQARILEWVAMPSSRGSSQPGIEPRSPTLQADSLPSEPPGKPSANFPLSVKLQKKGTGLRVNESELQFHICLCC